MPVNRTREKFIELAEKRVNKAIKAIRLVGNLSNKSNYKYEMEDAQKIIKALDREVRDLKARFTSEQTEDEVFTLK